MKNYNGFKKLFSILLSSVLLFSAVSVGLITVNAKITEFAGGSGTENSPYLIETKEQLFNVRNYLNAYYKLTADIKFSDDDFEASGNFYNNGEGWSPIGDNKNPFEGVFDGNGYTVSGIKINKNVEKNTYLGLFGYSNGTIDSLNISDSTIEIKVNSKTPSSDSILAYIGTIAGCGSVTNCTNSGNITISYESTSKSSNIYAGGLVGNGNAVKCDNSGNLSVNVMESGEQAVNIYLGGIAGKSRSIDQCSNLGSVTAYSERTYGLSVIAGGISGSAVNVTKSRNIGNIIISGSCNDISAAGICGFGINGSTVSQSYNTGLINGTNKTKSGGIIGYIIGKGNINDSFNTGMITGGWCGGIIGSASDTATIENCYNTGYIDGSYCKDSIIGNITQSPVIKNCYCLTDFAQR